MSSAGTGARRTRSAILNRASGWPSAAYLNVMVRTALTRDGVAAEAVLIERTDGQALTAQDLRKVKLPQPWILARGRELAGQSGEPTVTAARAGARGKGDEH